MKPATASRKRFEIEREVPCSLRRGLLMAVAGCQVLACDTHSTTGNDAGSASAPDAGTLTSASPVASSSTSAPPDAAAPLELLRLTLASGVRAKEPVDSLTQARPGQRVWAHVKLRNRSGRTKSVRLVFTLGGRERSTVDLDVEPSWSFRTWGYVTLRPEDRTGELSVAVLDDAAFRLGEARLPIR